MHVRLFPKPHILIDLDKTPRYWGDRVEFTNSYEPIFENDPEPNDDPKPDHIMEVPLGVYRRCSSALVKQLESRGAEFERNEDKDGTERVSGLLVVVREYVVDAQ